MAMHHLETGFFIHKGVISAVKRVQFFSDRMLYIIFRDRWCDTVFEYTCTEYKSDMKDRFYKELEHLFSHT